MENISEAGKPTVVKTMKIKLEKIISSSIFMYIFMIAILIYILISGYVLVFSGSLFVEALAKKWYMASATDYEYHSFFLGYLYGFASLFGVLGGLAILSTKPQRFCKHKVLLVIPSVIWSTFLVLDILRWGIRYWAQWLYLIPILLLCIFILFGVAKKVSIPYFAENSS